jgi:Holliday junction resolvasome RuvABC DNA-binding subunit
MIANIKLKNTILNIVDNQLNENNPSVTKATYERLQSLGYIKQQAKEKIAAVLVEETFDILKNQEPFNEERYTKKLKELK